MDTLIALKRTKVLLTEFDNVELNTWINNEITGYPKDAEIPSMKLIFSKESCKSFGIFPNGIET